MTRLILILGILALSGCASMPAPEVRRERISKWFKSWWKSNNSPDNASQPTAEDEVDTVKWLNYEIGNGSDQHPSKGP
jgi:hypothetical protein